MKSVVLMLAACVCVFLFSELGFSADGKAVSYKSGDETVSGMIYAPAGKGPFPALIVIHEWWGLNDWVKGQAAKFADEGYVALAVDLYRGKVAVDESMAHELMRGVPEDRAKRDLKAAYAFLAAQPNVKKDRIGAIGWCMGGGYALDVALEDVKAFQAAMEKLGKKIDVKIYPNAGHAFENPNNKTGYRAEDAADAWQRTVAFLTATLKK
jgi:carboxymethylenebutenolidase